MDSSTHRVEEERQKKLALEKQIAALQAQLAQIPDTAPSASDNAKATRSASPKRKQPEPSVLVPPTPSPKKKRKLNHDKRPSAPTIPKLALALGQPKSGLLKSATPPVPTKSDPSKLLSKLAAINKIGETAQVETVQRTTAFTDTPKPQPNEDAQFSTHQRDENLALVEELKPGPYEHTPPSNDPKFELLEPNSGIRLSSRVVPYDDFQDHLYGRYYLSPSRLYSCIRLLPDKQGYDIPVPGDWITIAVVAERGPVKFTRAPVGLGTEEGDSKPNKWNKGKQKEKEAPKPIGKKYVNMKLIDFGARASSSATGSKAVIRGDAFLSLLLFESDGFDLTTNEDGERARKLYKGGSRGAFETMAKVKEGDVIALLNPKILKPFQRANDSPHPVNNILAVTPESAASILVIGKSKDLGMCTAQKKDGKTCGSWCDKRVSEICEYHMQNAVQRQRAGRAEFSAGTSGMSTTSIAKRKFVHDPAKQFGLKPPEENMSSLNATYVVSGHIISGTNSDPRTLYDTENIGREGQAKARRKLKDDDKALRELLERDKEGMRAVMKAREFNAQGGKRDPKNLKDGKGGKEEEAEKCSKVKSAYTAEIIKNLGFDPTVKAGYTRSNERHIEDKLKALEGIRKTRKEVELGPRPGPKIRSGVVAPTKTKDTSGTSRKLLLSSAPKSDVDSVIDLDSD